MEQLPGYKPQTEHSKGLLTCLRGSHVGPAPGGRLFQGPPLGTSTLPWQITGHPPAILYVCSGVAAHLKRPIMALYLLRMPLVGYGPQLPCFHRLVFCSNRCATSAPLKSVTVGIPAPLDRRKMFAKETPSQLKLNLLPSQTFLLLLRTLGDE